jgi:hypothetical protein
VIIGPSFGPYRLTIGLDSLVILRFATIHVRKHPMAESPALREEHPIYEPPELAEVGGFAELTLGTVGQVSDDGALRDN